MLPEMDGFRVCEAIRLENATVPVLFLTAKNTSEDRITGLRNGADDYLTKTFNLEELILRVGILIRRGLQPESARTQEVYQIGDQETHLSSYEILDAEGHRTSLTRQERMLFKIF